MLKPVCHCNHLASGQGHEPPITIVLLVEAVLFCLQKHGTLLQAQPVLSGNAIHQRMCLTSVNHPVSHPVTGMTTAPEVGDHMVK